MIIEIYSSPINPGFMRSPQLPPEQNSMTIQRSEPFKYDPWYWVTYGEWSSERIEISCMISSTSSSAFSTSITLIATACPVRLSTLPSVSELHMILRFRGGTDPLYTFPKLPPPGLNQSRCRAPRRGRSYLCNSAWCTESQGLQPHSSCQLHSP